MKTRRERPARNKRTRQGFDELEFVQVSRATIGTVQQFIVRVGTAILGGDLTGDARGEYAIDIQSDRLGGAGGTGQVASGDYAVQIGALNTVSADYGVRIGYGGAVAGASGVGIGNNANAPGARSVAIGLNANAQGEEAVALGGADIRTTGAIGIGGSARLLNAAYALNTGVAPIIKRAAGLAAESNWTKHLAGAPAVFTSGIIDLKSAQLYTLALPGGMRLLLLALGIECESASGLVTQPTIRFGATFADQKYVADRQTTQLTAAAKREHYLPEALSDFETDPNFSVVTPATATTMTGRLYWVGLLLEDE